MGPRRWLAGSQDEHRCRGYGGHVGDLIPVTGFPCPRYLASLRGHVSAVYQIAWSADSRLLVSGSSDSTLKVWDVKAQKLAADLPGHADEVRLTAWRLPLALALALSSSLSDPFLCLGICC